MAGIASLRPASLLLRGAAAQHRAQTTRSLSFGASIVASRPSDSCYNSRLIACRATKRSKGKGGSKGGGKPPPPPPPPPSSSRKQPAAVSPLLGDNNINGEDDDDDVIYLADADDAEEAGGELDEDADGDGGGEDGWWDSDDDADLDGWDAAAGGANGDDDDGAAVFSTGGVAWGEAALGAARAAASRTPGLELYAFRVAVAQKRADVRLDKLDDAYGSPSIDEVASFACSMRAELIASLGEEAAGEIGVEAGSAGAERVLRLPGDLERFSELPMRVEYCESESGGGSGGGGEQAGGSSDGESATATATAPASAGVVVTRVLQLEALDLDAATTAWRLAEAKCNAISKGRGLTRRQREQRFDIPLAALRRVRLHVEL